MPPTLSIMIGLTASGARTVISLLTVIVMACCLPLGASAHTRTITISESSPPTRTSPQRTGADKNTRVINIKGPKTPASSGGEGDDICPDLNDYYCKSVGRDAWLAGGGAYLGRIAGVAWKDKGEVVGQYLETTAEAALPGGTLEDVISRNHLSAFATFYFIIEVKGLTARLFVEPHRIIMEQ